MLTGGSLARRASEQTSSLPRLVFERDEPKYELWETKTFEHFHLLLKETLFEEPRTAHTKGNAEMSL